MLTYFLTNTKLGKGAQNKLGEGSGRLGLDSLPNIAISVAETSGK